mgnify:CR=1 FL=1
MKNNKTFMARVRMTETESLRYKALAKFEGRSLSEEIRALLFNRANDLRVTIQKKEHPAQTNFI